MRIYEYTPAFLHAKVALVDDDWATVGSSNIDPLSLLLNLEANVVVRDARFHCANWPREFERPLPLPEVASASRRNRAGCAGLAPRLSWPGSPTSTCALPGPRVGIDAPRGGVVRASAILTPAPPPPFLYRRRPQPKAAA